MNLFISVVKIVRLKKRPHKYDKSQLVPALEVKYAFHSKVSKEPSKGLSWGVMQHNLPSKITFPG